MWFGSSETMCLRMKTETVEPGRSVGVNSEGVVNKRNRCCLSQEEMSVHSKPHFRKPLCFMTLGAGKLLILCFDSSHRRPSLM